MSVDTESRPGARDEAFSQGLEYAALGDASIEAPSPHTYEVLRSPDPRTESDGDMRARYVRYTEKMIAETLRIANGGETAADGQPKDTGVTMVFLDKSARPTYWLMNELWDLYAPGYRRPDVKFVNIDREQWQDRAGKIDPDTGVSNVDIRRIPASEIDNLRRTFSSVREPGASEFKDRKILIVDETRTTGTTLEIAKQMFKDQFDDAQSVEGYHWMVRPSGRSRTSEVPIWYQKSYEGGRGVGNRKIEVSLSRDPSSRQHMGAGFLSTRLEAPDPMSDALRTEFKYLREDILNGFQRVTLSTIEDTDVAPELLKVVNEWRASQHRGRSSQDSNEAGAVGFAEPVQIGKPLVSIVESLRNAGRNEYQIRANQILEGIKQGVEARSVSEAISDLRDEYLSRREDDVELQRLTQLLLRARQQALLQDRLNEDRERLHRAPLTHEEYVSLGNHYELLRREACEFNHSLRLLMENSAHHFTRDELTSWIAQASQGRRRWAEGEVTGAASELAVHAALQGMPELKSVRYGTVDEDLAGYDFVCEYQGKLLSIDAKTGHYPPVNERKHGHWHLQVSVPREVIRNFSVSRRGLERIRHDLRYALKATTGAPHHVSHTL